jgi:hypothetical protein
MIDPYSKNSKVLFEGKERFFLYNRTEPINIDTEVSGINIYFKLI